MGHPLQVLPVLRGGACLLPTRMTSALPTPNHTSGSYTLNLTKPLESISLCDGRKYGFF